MASQSIGQFICAKTWTSEGAVRHSTTTGARPDYYPKIGMKFTGTLSVTNIPPPLQSVKKWHKDANGNFQSTAVTVPDLFFKTVRFKVDQRLESAGGSVPDIDPETGKKTILFPDGKNGFISRYQKTDFYENGNLLISRPLIVPELNNVAVTYVIELFVSPLDKQTYMLQRSYWNGDYLGTYCCS